MKLHGPLSLSRFALFITACAVLLLPRLSLGAEDDSWQTDYKQALAQAAKEHKQVLLDFTGSDWCPYCIQMDKEVLEKPEFKKYAGENLILVKLDYPRKKQLPPAETAQNRALQQQFSIDGYPTYIVVNASGKEINRQVGAMEGGPSAFIDWAKSKK
jgi:protein disulfide-isomerase